MVLELLDGLAEVDADVGKAAFRPFGGSTAAPRTATGRSPTWISGPCARRPRAPPRSRARGRCRARGARRARPSLRGEPVRSSAGRGEALGEEVRGQNLDVFRALAQRREVEWITLRR